MMNRLLSIIKNMKYRHKLTILLVVASLVPMTVLVLYSHTRMSSLVRQSEQEDMHSILEQTTDSIDSQIAVFANLLNYLTYSPEIQEIIQEKNLDNYTAYEKYTEVADPLLSVPKSYHDAILQIQLFAESIKVRHEYTLVPMKDIEKEWWNGELENSVRIQWLVNEEKKEIAAVREIYEGEKLEGVLCITLDYDKVFQPFGNMVVSQECGGVIVDENGDFLFHAANLKEKEPELGSNMEAFMSRMEEKWYSVSRQSEENGWKYCFYKPRSVIAASVSVILMEEIPLILGCMVIILLLGLAFSRIFTRKIELLTENMDRVNRGSREVTVYSDSEDEIGLLIRSFRRMMEETDRLIHEVYENRIVRKEFELKALQAQINPHFLYNSLSIINWMALRSNQKEISKVTLSLSMFYRTALSKGEDMVTMESSIKNIEAYLDIQLVMHDHDFQVQWDVDSGIRNEKVPKLLIQPVVENALEHGLDEKEEGEKILKLSFVEDGNDVLMVVEDNGMGMDQKKAETLVTYQAQGYGLKNVNDRVCLLYGEQYAIRIFSRIGEGTRVEIRVPKGDPGR